MVDPPLGYLNMTAAKKKALCKRHDEWIWNAQENVRQEDPGFSMFVSYKIQPSWISSWPVSSCTLGPS